MLVAAAVGAGVLALAFPPSAASPAAELGLTSTPSPTIADAPQVLVATAVAGSAGAGPAGAGPQAPAVREVPAVREGPAPAPPVCRAAVLVHGGGYFAGDASALEIPFAAPLRQAGFRVWNVDYPLLSAWPDLAYDPTQPWYPRPDVDSTPANLRAVHDRATEAVVPAVVEALATGCRVVLVGVSAGGSIVADLAHRFPSVAEADLVVGASLTPDRIGGAPLQIFYGADDQVVLPAASIATCALWRAAGSACETHRFEGAGHVSADQAAAALTHLLRDALATPAVPRRA